MSPTPPSPTTKLPMAHRTSSLDSTEGIRKRVCKACDRCRLKKSKCDGSSPCSRCKADNAICVFGERKKSHDKVYPKGYVEMLEQQQAQLVSGLQEMYRRLQAGHRWESDSLPESNGHPLTHDILAALNLLDQKHDGAEVFEEDVSKLQARLLAEGNGYTHPRRGSISSDSEHSQHGTARSVATSTPILSRPSVFRGSLQLDSTSGSPLVQSPVPQQLMGPTTQTSSLATTYQHDPSLYAPEWAQVLSEAVALQQQKPQFACTETQSPSSLDDLDMVSEQWTGGLGLNADGMFNINAMPPYLDMQSLTALDSMDVDFSKFVNSSSSMELYN